MSEEQTAEERSSQLTKFESVCGVSEESGAERTHGLTETQVDRLRNEIKREQAPLLEEIGASSDQIGCVRHQVDRLSSAEVRAFLAAGEDARRLIVGIFKACGLA